MNSNQPADRDEKLASKRDVRSFWTMVLLAAQNAYNDKAAQFFLIPLAGWLAVLAGTSGESTMEYKLGLLIVLPFILFSPLAGWLSDRFSKTWVLRGGAILQLLVLALIVVAVHFRWINLAVFGFFLLALQSTLLSPAKKGIVKEMLGSERLGFASGVLEMASVLAICAGQIASGFWFDSRLRASGDGWQAAGWPLVLILILAIPAVLLSFSIKVYPSPSKRPFKASILWEHFKQVGQLFENRRLKWSGLGVAFFWFFGGFINLVAIQLGKELSGGGVGFGSELAWFIAAASGGIILGGFLGAIGCKRYIELGLVPIGGVIMVLGCALLAMTDIHSVWMKVWMVFAGVGGAIFLVPLNAYLQDIVDPAKRGSVLAGLNLLDCMAGVVAVIVQLAMFKLHMPLWVQFTVMAMLCAVATGFSSKLLPKHFLRFTLLSIFRIFYRQKILNAERMPETGGVLILPNHVTYLDAFVLTAASPRPIRFLMFEGYFKKGGLIRWFVKMFDTVPISKTKAKEALQVAAEAVKQGGVVCIFPEGQLTRSGSMNEMKRGFEMIARKADCPVMPVYMDGLWGSIFSFERGKFIKKVPYKMPYGVTVAWGEPVSSREMNSTRLRKELYELSAEAFGLRELLRHPGRTLDRSVTLLSENEDRFQRLLNEVEQRGERGQRALLANALQLAECPVVRVKSTILVDAESALAPLYAIALPAIRKLKVILVGNDMSNEELQKLMSGADISAAFGAETLYQRLNDMGVTGFAYYHEGGELYPENALPCFAMGVVDDEVISISIAHPNAVTATNQFQAGWKEGSIGRLLPGYAYEQEDEEVSLRGVVTKDKVIRILAKLDSEGFLFPEC
ncbi:MFS transporter [Rubritalea squalenifaciens]|nr:MFS transporter [Rubritalea squalenifaciens]